MYWLQLYWLQMYWTDCRCTDFLIATWVLIASKLIYHFFIGLPPISGAAKLVTSTVDPNTIYQLTNWLPIDNVWLFHFWLLDQLRAFLGLIADYFTLINKFDKFPAIGLQHWPDRPNSLQRSDQPGRARPLKQPSHFSSYSNLLRYLKMSSFSKQIWKIESLEEKVRVFNIMLKKKQVLRKLWI